MSATSISSSPSISVLPKELLAMIFERHVASTVN
jgi:hypothetical protein